MKEEIKLLRKAYQKYVTDEREDIEINVLKYIFERIENNKAEIEKIIEMNKSSVSFNDILICVKNEIELTKKSYGKTVINKDGFMFSQVLAPIGIIAVEAFEPVEIIKYWIKAIKSRNAVAVSSVEYDEQSIEALVLIIIKEALKKYDLDENLVMYLSYEECFYEYFDKVVYTYNKQGTTRDNPKAELILSSDDQQEKAYVYVEDETLRLEAERNKNATILEGNMEDVLVKIANCKVATIYTKNSEIAFKFINFANCKNVFVNTETENTAPVLKSDDEFYQYKNIIIPVPDNVLKINKEEPKRSSEKIEIKQNNDEKNDNRYNIESNLKKETMEFNDTIAMVKYKESLWKKIKKRFKDLFKF